MIPMRHSILSLAALAALTACGLRGGHGTPRMQTGREHVIQVYGYGTPTPRCPYTQLGTVQGTSHRRIEAAARQMTADAVILDPYVATTAAGTYSGRAIRFTEKDCRA